MGIKRRMSLDDHRTLAPDVRAFWNAIIDLRVFCSARFPKQHPVNRRLGVIYNHALELKSELDAEYQIVAGDDFICELGFIYYGKP